MQQFKNNQTAVALIPKLLYFVTTIKTSYQLSSLLPP